MAITKSDVLKMSSGELKKAMENPEKLAEIEAALATPDSEEPVPVETPETEIPAESSVQTDEEKAAEAAKEAERVAAEKAAAEKAALEAKAAQEEAYKQAGLTVTTDEHGNITKIVKTYQARDEAGNPIGRPTYLEAKTWAELSIKQQAAHENAVRFSERLKKQKVTFKKEDQQLTGLSDDELIKLQEDLKGEDREKAGVAAEQIRRNDVIKAQQEALRIQREAEQTRIAYQFMSNHLNDYNPCEANKVLLVGYLEDNQLEFTLDNLEVAFAAVESRLAPRESARPAPANPVVEAPAATVPPPVVAQPAQPAAPANPEPPARRPGVNAGLIPGQNSGSRPTGKPQGLTKAEIRAWSAAQMRVEMKRSPERRAEIERVLASK